MSAQRVPTPEKSTVSSPSEWERLKKEIEDKELEEERRMEASRIAFEGRQSYRVVQRRRDLLQTEEFEEKEAQRVALEIVKRRCEMKTELDRDQVAYEERKRQRELDQERDRLKCEENARIEEQKLGEAIRDLEKMSQEVTDKAWKKFERKKGFHAEEELEDVRAWSTELAERGKARAEAMKMLAEIAAIERGQCQPGVGGGSDQLPSWINGGAWTDGGMWARSEVETDDHPFHHSRRGSPSCDELEEERSCRADEYERKREERLDAWWSEHERKRAEKLQREEEDRQQRENDQRAQDFAPSEADRLEKSWRTRSATRWVRLQKLVDVRTRSETDSELAFKDFVWPIFPFDLEAKLPADWPTKEDISSASLYSFLLDHLPDNEHKAIVRETMRAYHPDRFARLVEKIPEDKTEERERVQALGLKVTQGAELVVEILRRRGRKEKEKRRRSFLVMKLSNDTLGPISSGKQSSSCEKGLDPPDFPFESLLPLPRVIIPKLS